MLNIFHKKGCKASNIHDPRLGNLLGLLKKGDDSRYVGPREAFGFVDKDRIPLHRSIQMIFWNPFILPAKTISYVRVFSLQRNESSIHAIGWWFWKYNEKTDCLSRRTACRWQAFRPANPQQYESFEAFNKPPLSPPGWLFPVVWTILFVLMGIAFHLVVVSGKPGRTALTVYGVQIFFNFLWSILLFNLAQYLFAFVWLVVLWLLILVTAVLFYRISRPAGYLMLPYLLWVTFAGDLNFAIYLLN